MNQNEIPVRIILGYLFLFGSIFALLWFGPHSSENNDYTGFKKENLIPGSVVILQDKEGVTVRFEIIDDVFEDRINFLGFSQNNPKSTLYFFQKDKIKDIIEPSDEEYTKWFVIAVQKKVENK